MLCAVSIQMLVHREVTVILSPPLMKSHCGGRSGSRVSCSIATAFDEGHYGACDDSPGCLSSEKFLSLDQEDGFVVPARGVKVSAGEKHRAAFVGAEGREILREW